VITSVLSAARPIFYVGSAVANNKAKCFLFKSQLLFTFATPEYLGAAPLHIKAKLPNTGAVPLLCYHKYTRLLGGFIFFGSGYIFFGSVDLFSSV
jgi:hypothetical protein